jgi:putative PIN family toxin of toxin-antitoxin system
VRIVLDTNVLVSGLISSNAAPGRIIDLMRKGVVSLALDDRILSEYQDVLRRPQLQRYFDNAAVDHIMDYIRSSSAYEVVIHFIHGLPDELDAPFLEVARQAELVLVTGNMRHYPADLRCGVAVLSPAEFMRLPGWV